MASLGREARIEKLLAKKKEIEEELKREQKAKEEEMMAICWKGLEPHVITRQDALNFKKAMEDDSIIELLFKRELLPKPIMKAISEREEIKSEEKRIN